MIILLAYTSKRMISADGVRLPAVMSARINTHHKPYRPAQPCCALKAVLLRTPPARLQEGTTATLKRAAPGFEQSSPARWKPAARRGRGAVPGAPRSSAADRRTVPAPAQRRDRAFPPRSGPARPPPSPEAAPPPTRDRFTSRPLPPRRARPRLGRTSPPPGPSAAGSLMREPGVPPWPPAGRAEPSRAGPGRASRGAAGPHLTPLSCRRGAALALVTCEARRRRDWRSGGAGG